MDEKKMGYRRVVRALRTRHEASTDFAQATVSEDLGGGCTATWWRGAVCLRKGTEVIVLDKDQIARLLASKPGKKAKEAPHV